MIIHNYTAIENFKNFDSKNRKEEII